MNRIPSRRSQLGYLYGIPLILLALFLALALVLPRLPAIGQKLLLVVATVPTLYCFFYLIVVPGWTPGAVLRSRVRRLAWFLGCTAVTVAAVAAFILR